MNRTSTFTLNKVNGSKDIKVKLPNWKQRAPKREPTFEERIAKMSLENSVPPPQYEEGDEWFEEDYKAPNPWEIEKLKQFRKQLPAYRKRSEVLDMIEKHQVILIKGETGCGKNSFLMTQLF